MKYTESNTQESIIEPSMIQEAEKTYPRLNLRTGKIVEKADLPYLTQDWIVIPAEVGQAVFSFELKSWIVKQHWQNFAHVPIRVLVAEHYMADILTQMTLARLANEDQEEEDED